MKKKHSFTSQASQSLCPKKNGRWTVSAYHSFIGLELLFAVLCKDLTPISITQIKACLKKTCTKQINE